MVTQTKTFVEQAGNFKVTYQLRSTFFGLVRWWEEIKAERLSHDIYIVTEHPIDNIFFNGEKIK